MLQAISRVLFWTYSRGSWQYDILCALILCFIFLTPRTVFDGSAFRSAVSGRTEVERVHAADEIKAGSQETGAAKKPEPDAAAN